MSPRRTPVQSQEAIWRQVADDVGAEYLAQRGPRPITVQLRTGDWIVTLDVYRAPDRKVKTRLRAPFVNATGFRFLIYTAGVFSEIGKRLVLLQDLDVGHPGIDRRYVVQSPRPAAVRELMRNDRIRNVVWAQKGKVRFGVVENDGVLGGQYPDGVDLLFFEAPGRILDRERLVALFGLMAATLPDVSRASVEEDEGERQIRRLSGPGGIITGRVTLWEGDPIRHDAADQLARLADARALPALVDALRTTDPVLRAKAVFALGEIGDPAAAPELIRLLGARKGQLRRPLSEDASEALGKLGLGALVGAFEAALAGEPDRLAQQAGRHRPAAVDALLGVLEGASRPAVAHAVQALNRLGAVEALPELRRRMTGFLVRGVRSAYESAIEALESRTGLPRPSGPGDTPTDTLPRPAEDRAPPETETLPRASEPRER